MLNLYDVIYNNETGTHLITVFAISHIDAMELVERCGYGFAKQACLYDGDGSDCITQIRFE